jgi:hypothetical protein
MSNAKPLRSLFVGLGILLSSACGGATFAMVPAQEVVFAKGQVDVVTISEAGNGTYKVHVEHLGDPGKLNPSATVYVVWVMPKGKEDATIQNMGAIKVDSDFNGDLEFNSTFKAFEVTVTPEATADVTKPTGRDILKTNVAVD